jgi:hypothetical protein
VITPGVTFTGIACLNIEATSVRIQTSSSSYDQTVNSPGNDVVKLDLAGTASDVITITITNTAGLAKCGEIVVGTVQTIGTLKPQPVVGITDYSVKTQDERGNWSITERAYSEKLSCVASITYSSLDTVIALLEEYRATPLVWVGNTSYSCLIIYGFVKDWNVPVETRGKALMALEIEGLT